MEKIFTDLKEAIRRIALNRPYPHDYIEEYPDDMKNLPPAAYAYAYEGTSGSVKSCLFGLRTIMPGAGVKMRKHPSSKDKGTDAASKGCLDALETMRKAIDRGEPVGVVQSKTVSGAEPTSGAVRTPRAGTDRGRTQ